MLHPFGCHLSRGSNSKAHFRLAGAGRGARGTLPLFPSFKNHFLSPRCFEQSLAWRGEGRDQVRPPPYCVLVSRILPLLVYMTMAGRTPVPKDVHVLIARTCDCGMFHSKGELRLQMELTVQSADFKNILDDLGGLGVITKALMWGRGRQKRQTKDGILRKTLLLTLGFEDGRVRGKGCGLPPKAGKGKKTGCLLKAPEETRPCRYPDLAH